MRISTDQSPEAGATTTTPSQWEARTAADYTSLLLELARVERGFRYYDETDARRRPLAERAHLAVRSELDRAGAIELRLTLLPCGFELPGSERPLEATGPIVDLEDALRRHGVRCLRLDPTLTRTALAGLFDLLGQGHDRLASPHHLARTLAARDTRGIRINDIDPEAEPGTPSLTSTPPRASASLASTLLPNTPAPPEPRHDDEKPQLDDAPLVAPARDDRGERLRARLIELDATTDDDAYRRRVGDVVTWAQDLWREDVEEECLRAMLVLADHAVGIGGRSAAQARAAAASFAALAQADRLPFLIERATQPGSAGIRAATLLLQLGEIAVPAILDRLAEEEDDDRAAPLRALILTQGEAALPTLVAAIEGHHVRRARIGTRLAGELQNPEVLPVLIRSLRVPDLSRRLETIRALSFLPGAESKRALTAALASDLEEIAAAAGRAIASSDGSEAVPVLLDVLEASLHDARTKLGCTLIETLGQLGDERAVPRLCSILERRPVLRRAHWHALQLAAIDALAILPTKEGKRTIERAAANGPQSVRARARAALDGIAKGG